MSQNIVDYNAWCKIDMIFTTKHENDKTITDKQNLCLVLSLLITTNHLQGITSLELSHESWITCRNKKIYIYVILGLLHLIRYSNTFVSSCMSSQSQRRLGLVKSHFKKIIKNLKNGWFYYNFICVILFIYYS